MRPSEFPPRSGGQGRAVLNTQVRYRMKFHDMLAMVARPKATVLMAAGNVTIPGAIAGNPRRRSAANATSPGVGHTLEKNWVRPSWIPHEAEMVVTRKRPTWLERRASCAANTQPQLSRKLTAMARPPETSLATQTRSKGTEKILVNIM